MLLRQSPQISAAISRRVSLFVMVAVCLMGLAWSGLAMAEEQGLKIRLLSAEEEDVWDKKTEQIGSDILTPPGEGKPEQLASPLALQDDGQVSGEPSLLSGEEAGVPSGSVLDQPSSLYQEPAGSIYDQQRQFQQRLLGLHNHLLSEQPEEEEPSVLTPERNESSADGPSSPELVGRFAPFQRIRFAGSRFLGLGTWQGSPSHEAFRKLFPWNRTPGRNQGVGEPLINDSWRWAPFGAGWFMGFMDGTTMLNNSSANIETTGKTGYFGGYHLNWDFDHYWGFEFRYGMASLPQSDDMQNYDSDTNGAVTTDMLRRHASLKYGDFSFLYYPWGDSRWRPYARLGLGWGYVKFTDLDYNLWSNTTMAMPFGIGLKYRYSRRIVFRGEMVDNFIFGEKGINPQHNFSMTAGIEFRFGGARKAYWPYNPGRHYW